MLPSVAKEDSLDGSFMAGKGLYNIALSVSSMTHMIRSPRSWRWGGENICRCEHECALPNVRRYTTTTMSINSGCFSKRRSFPGLVDEKQGMHLSARG